MVYYIHFQILYTKNPVLKGNLWQKSSKETIILPSLEVFQVYQVRNVLYL